MSYSPPPTPRKLGRSPRQALYALAIVIVAAAALALLAFNYMRVTGGAAPIPTTTSTIALTPAPTFTMPGVATSSLTPTPLTVAPSASTVAPTQPVATASAAPSLTSSPSTLSPAEQTLAVLDAADVPLRDPYSLTARLRLKTPGTPLPRTTGKEPGNYTAGHKDTFFISDLPSKRYYTVTATVREVTDHAYWYVQDGRPLDDAIVNTAARTFESRIYPTNHSLFGTEPSPGVDNDPRITVLLVSIPDAGGYFSSADEYTRTLNPYSNEREIIYINADGGLTGIVSTLAHEFQHMIHWNESPHHDVWLNEGASVLAADTNGYSIAGVDLDFMREPDTQLNAWQPDPSSARANYGASFLFLDYLRAYYGGDSAIRSVVQAPGEGTDAVDHALEAAGRTERFRDVFTRWTLANLLDGEPGAAEQKLDYPDRSVSVSPQESLSLYPAQREGSVSQFGTDYVELAPPSSGSLSVTFEGQAEVPVIAARAHSGQGIIWSNRGDLADSMATTALDLRSVSKATLGYYVWLDTEEDLDYGYAEISTDGGATWDTLEGQYTTATNPNGTNYGNGYTGQSLGRQGADDEGWLREQVDINKYAGKEALLRFEYVTDDGYNAGGVAFDDVTVPEIGFSDDAESPTNRWQMAGFARVANTLPQTYALTVVTFDESGGFKVQPVQVDPDGKATFEVAAPFKRAVLVISGTTTHNIQKADYTLRVEGKK